MAVNQYGQTYQGNDDFLGWLAAGNGENSMPVNMVQGNTNFLLSHLGNDGRSGGNATADAVGQKLYNEWQSGRNPNNEVEKEPVYDPDAAARAQEEAVKANMRKAYDRQINNINENIGSLQWQLDNALAGVKNRYDTYRNEQQSAYDANKNTYDKDTLQNQQDLQNNRNTITKNTAKSLRGILRVLGAMGAGGGSVAQVEIPRAAMDSANDRLAKANTVYQKNQQNLDTNWGNYNVQFDNDRKKLEDWYDGEVKAKKQENYNKGQELLNSLVGAYTNRAQYGGNYQGNIDDTYNRMANYRNMSNALGAFSPTQYTGKSAVYKAPELSSYNPGEAGLSTTVTNSDTSATTPILAVLQGENRKKTALGV